MKTYSATNFPSPQDKMFETVKTNLLSETTISQGELAFICLNSAPDTILVSSLLTLNIFDTLF